MERLSRLRMVFLAIGFVTLALLAVIVISPLPPIQKMLTKKLSITEVNLTLAKQMAEELYEDTGMAASVIEDDVPFLELEASQTKKLFESKPSELVALFSSHNGQILLSFMRRTNEPPKTPAPAIHPLKEWGNAPRGYLELVYSFPFPSLNDSALLAGVLENRDLGAVSIILAMRQTISKEWTGIPSVRPFDQTLRTFFQVLQAEKYQYLILAHKSISWLFLLNVLSFVGLLYLRILFLRRYIAETRAEEVAQWAGTDRVIAPSFYDFMFTWNITRLADYYKAKVAEQKESLKPGPRQHPPKFVCPTEICVPTRPSGWEKHLSRYYNLTSGTFLDPEALRLYRKARWLYTQDSDAARITLLAAIKQQEIFMASNPELPNTVQLIQDLANG